MAWPVDEVIRRIDDSLTVFLAQREQALAEVGGELDELLKIARTFVLDGGKRLRPMFAYWGWRSVHDGSDDDGGLITAAASLELLHACALVHDDVMDASATRRGRPSAHHAFAELHRASGWTGDSDVFGTSAAIILGDLLFSWADAMFESARLHDTAKASARRVWDEMRQLVMAGQYLDVRVQAKGTFSPEDALRVAMFKTSKYTVEGPLHFGAAAGGAREETFAALTAYGIPLGEAFQLRDDILGVFGDPALTGKPAGDDLREGKRTLLVALAMAAADADQRELLRAGLGDRSLDEARVAPLRDVIVASGALAEVEARILACAEQARAALRSPAIRPSARDALAALVAAATERHA